MYKYTYTQRELYTSALYLHTYVHIHICILALCAHLNSGRMPARSLGALSGERFRPR